jgi:hypothetical protein
MHGPMNLKTKFSYTSSKFGFLYAKQWTTQLPQTKYKQRTSYRMAQNYKTRHVVLMGNIVNLTATSVSLLWFFLK